MSSAEQPVAASLFHTEWKDLSDTHKKRRERLEAQIDGFPQPQKALYIVGAIGSGKTELLYHGLTHTWTQTELPALCVTMSKLLNDIIDETGIDPQSQLVTQAEIYNTIKSICFDRLDQISTLIENDGDMNQVNYLPDAPPDSSQASEYFGNLFNREIEAGDLEKLAKQAQNDYFILHVDEMEETYDRLDKVIEGHQGPLREVVNKIANGTSSFYFIGSFAYASIQELGQAEGRRTRNLNLPIIRPDDARKILGDAPSRHTLNLAWWAGRGRPGWLSKAIDEVDLVEGEFEGLYDTLDVFLPSQISNVDLLATQPLESHLENNRVDSAGRNLLTYLLLNPGPVKINEFEDPEQVYGILDRNGELPVYTMEERTPLEDVLTSITEDIQRMALYEKYGEQSRELRQYIKRVLSAVTDDDAMMVFGDGLSTIPNRGNRFKELVAEPLTERAHDIALEEIQDESDELEFLYQLSQQTGNLSATELDEAYPQSVNNFSDAPRETSEIKYVSVSIKTLKIAFPSLITNPILNFRNASLGKSGQIEILAEKLNTVGQRHRRLTQFGDLLRGETE
ncbi:hypothetical protein AArcSl_1625 [Halalkaliarchaeum desulfuricum]|uniref:Uncharacterized protein n=1 Tax=Halalkaliarchaeum desulfuricum TaxID=2055893 RepID=A0A343TJI2_9EURY|nr:hypothetical protein [Halalkaliarchaeum desulfuricum]AUX09254.1 hypothetical protein AArcSl_1625 [Halalkaliarchaeum desulfuricum]